MYSLSSRCRYDKAHDRLRRAEEERDQSAKGGVLSDGKKLAGAVIKSTLQDLLEICQIHKACRGYVDGVGGSLIVLRCQHNPRIHGGAQCYDRDNYSAVPEIVEREPQPPARST